ncbi:MAG: NTP transferase domain-containing protein, partial [Actinomycetota bacterium]|nr:NTP transferase domain-containing protein [Actinomycetota bacterium]
MTDWLILAGGAGSRLGQDKAATSFNGRTLLDRARATIDSVDEEATIHVLDQAYPGGPAAAVVAGLA